MKILALFKFLRGTRFDIFGRTEERRLERQLIVDYEKTISLLISSLSQDNLELAIEIASVPEQIRGYDAVKRDNASRAKRHETELLDQFGKPESLLVIQGTGDQTAAGR